jgi:hypothetical protein
MPDLCWRRRRRIHERRARRRLGRAHLPGRRRQQKSGIAERPMNRYSFMREIRHL